MKTIKGNLITLAKQKQFDVILHGCNCFCNFGAGIALTIKNEFPKAYRADCKTIKGDKSKLGSYSLANIDKHELTIVNCYTQYHWNGKHSKTNYTAIENCLIAVAKEFGNMRIGIPKIGAGLGGGDWRYISTLIDKHLKDVTYVEYDNS